MSSLKKKCILFLEFDWDFKVFKKKKCKNHSVKSTRHNFTIKSFINFKKFEYKFYLIKFKIKGWIPPPKVFVTFFISQIKRICQITQNIKKGMIYNLSNPQEIEKK